MIRRILINLAIVVPIGAVVIGGAFYMQYQRQQIEAQASGQPVQSFAAYSKAKFGLPHARNPEGAEEQVLETVDAALVSAPSFADRLKEFFVGKRKPEVEEEAPRRLVCHIRKGAKHCFMPKEEDE